MARHRTRYRYHAAAIAGPLPPAIAAYYAIIVPPHRCHYR
jgi:hypothetical protein